MSNGSDCPGCDKWYHECTCCLHCHQDPCVCEETRLWRLETKRIQEDYEKHRTKDLPSDKDEGE
jgi:hypothetical protein